MSEADFARVATVSWLNGAGVMTTIHAFQSEHSLGRALNGVINEGDWTIDLVQLALAALMFIWAWSIRARTNS